MLVSNPLLEPLRELFRAVSRNEQIIGGLKADPEAPFRSMVEDLPDPLIVTDPEGVVLYANAAWREELDLRIEDTLGRRLADLHLGMVRSEHAQQRAELLGRLTPDNRSGTLELSLRGGRHVQVLYKGWFDAQGELLAVSAVSRDRTDAHHFQAELEDTNRLLADSNRDLQDFAHIASHDLQEPLRKISAFSERLGDRYSDSLDDRGRDYLDRIGSASERMQQLIQSLLDFSRVNSRAGDLVETDLSTVADEVLHDLEVAIEESGAIVCIGPLPTMHCDPVQIRQLLQNLIGNAIKFRREGERPRVEVHATEAGPDAEGRWTITVADNGIGFEQEYADRIFGPFQRLHGRGEYQGSGIGLAVCRRIVERHGGSITATSAPGEGATFTVTL